MDQVVVHLAKGRGYIWNAADVKLLREKHRFIGALIGPNTGNTHQEHLPHSLPLLLLPEELHLGLKRGWFLVAPEPLPPDVLSQAPVPVPTPDDLEKLAAGVQVGGAANRRVQDPSQDSRAIGQSSPSDNSLDNGEEAQALGRVAASQLPGESPSKSAVGTSWTARNVWTEAGGDEAKAANAEAALVDESLSVLLDRESQHHSQAIAGTAAGEQQPAAAAREPGSAAAQPAKKKKGNREEDYWLSFAGAMQSNILTKILDSATAGPQPLQQEESDRYMVFEDMYNRGYTITSGTNFGGNFLAYAGDPSDYHSEFVVRVLTKASRLPFASLSAASRVALTARKKFLLALVTKGNDNGKRQVQYIVIAPDLVTASGINRGLRVGPPPGQWKKT